MSDGGSKAGPPPRRPKPGESPTQPKLTRRELLALAAPYSGAVAALLVSACSGSRGRHGGGDDDDDSGAVCTDTCTYAGDGVCDDGGLGSDYDVCEYGNDCEDCGPRDGGYTEYAEYPDYTEYAEYSEGYPNSYPQYIENYPDHYEYYPNYDNYGA